MNLLVKILIFVFVILPVLIAIRLVTINPNPNDSFFTILLTLYKIPIYQLGLLDPVPGDAMIVFNFLMSPGILISGSPAFYRYQNHGYGGYRSYY